MGDIVIGSGPAGVSAARGLMARGRDVLLLDAGVEMDDSGIALKTRLASSEPDEWPARDLASILEPVQAAQTDIMRPFGSDFLFRDPVGFFGGKGPPPDIDLRPSFALGGLSNGWGASVLPYRAEDIRDWPVTAEELAPHYAAVRGFMPIAATADDLAPLFPALPIDDDTGLPLGSQATRLLERLEARREALRQSGIHFGRSRVAVEASRCRRCRMCLHGCPYDVIFNAGSTLAELRREPGFAYRRGVYVTRFEESGDGVRVRVRDLRDQREETLQADRLFVGCGVLPTARLVLGSLDRLDAPIVLKDSQHFYLPMLHAWRPRPDPAAEDLHVLTQLFLEILDPEVDRHTVHVQLYSHNDFYAADIAKRFGPAAGLASPLIGALSRRLLVAQGFLHSDVSPEITISLASGDTEPELELGWRGHPETWSTLARARRRLARALRSVGLLALTPLLRPGTVGSSFHCGGSFPMRERPGPLETDRWGRLHGLERVHLLDASVFPSIPATTITLSVMANAHRIASESPA